MSWMPSNDPVLGDPMSCDALELRGRGYAVEAARAAIDWVFSTFEIEEIIHCISPENIASQAVGRKLGARIAGETQMSGDTVDIWVTGRNAWLRQN